MWCWKYDVMSPHLCSKISNSKTGTEMQGALPVADNSGSWTEVLVETFWRGGTVNCPGIFSPLTPFGKSPGPHDSQEWTVAKINEWMNYQWANWWLIKCLAATLSDCNVLYVCHYSNWDLQLKVKHLVPINQFTALAACCTLQATAFYLHCTCVEREGGMPLHFTPKRSTVELTYAN